MLCFIDESGDPGMKVGQGSSRFLTVAIVLFQDKDEANKCDAEIDELRKSLSLKSNFEFHFVHCSHNKRIKFYTCVSKSVFHYWTITIDKTKIYGRGFNYKESFYKFACKLVFNNARKYLENAIVIFDKSGSREFNKELQTYIKKQMNEKDSVKVKRVKSQASHKNNLIQLADMVCGAVSYSLRKKNKNAEVYRNMINKHEIHCQIWPAK